MIGSRQGIRYHDAVGAVAIQPPGSPVSDAHASITSWSRAIDLVDGVPLSSDPLHRGTGGSAGCA